MDGKAPVTFDPALDWTGLEDGWMCWVCCHPFTHESEDVHSASGVQPRQAGSGSERDSSSFAFLFSSSSKFQQGIIVGRDCRKNSQDYAQVRNKAWSKKKADIADLSNVLLQTFSSAPPSFIHIYQPFIKRPLSWKTNFF